jgi:hypothetical protein
MAKYLITATEIVNREMYVEADSQEQAMDIAERAIDGWHETGNEFTVDYATLIED